MHAIKGGWVGQTFALAKINETGGKKSRIRRSKEERKAMVESFIKKYQESNNGNFPSLNLTHKEVGGSFYIIREIVREIIQENRVLGPGKLAAGEPSIDHFLEQNPLGSISTAPQTLLPIQSNGRPLVPSHIDDASNGSFSVSDGLTVGSEFKKLDSEQINGGNLVDVTNETDKEAILEMQVMEPLESEKQDKEVAATTSKVTQITSDVVVETFPLRPVHAPTDSTDGSSTDLRKLNKNLGQTENKNVIAGLENGGLKSDDMNSSEVTALTDEKEVEDNEDLLSEKKSNLADRIVSDVVVETFPLRPVDAPTDSTDGSSTEVRKLNENLEQTENKNAIVGLEIGSLKSDDMNSSEVTALTDKKEVEDNEDLLSEKKSNLADRIVLESISDPLLESSDCSTVKSALHDNLNGAAQGVVSYNDALTSEQSQAIDAEVVNASHGIQPKFHGTYAGRSSGESTTQETVVVKVDSRHANSQKGRKKPLDRINLESWEGASKGAAQSETRPLWAIFKSFISAFVKFWSE